MNKSMTPTVQTIAAAENFADWLRTQMRRRGLTCAQLAQAIGYERKAIVAWRVAKTAPRLDAVAALFAYFGKDRIEIEINPRAITEE